MLSINNRILKVIGYQFDLITSCRYFYSKKFDNYEQKALIAQAAIGIINSFEYGKYLNNKRSIR